MAPAIYDCFPQIVFLFHREYLLAILGSLNLKCNITPVSLLCFSLHTCWCTLSWWDKAEIIVIRPPRSPSQRALMPEEGRVLRCLVFRALFGVLQEMDQSRVAVSQVLQWKEFLVSNQMATPLVRKAVSHTSHHHFTLRAHKARTQQNHHGPVPSWHAGTITLWHN